MKELGISGKQFHLREVNRPESFDSYGFVDMSKRVGADLRLDLAPSIRNGLRNKKDFNWTRIPKGIVFSKLPHLEPINTKNTWMLNISKFKTHPMGMTICCKNLQGTVVHNYQKFATGTGAMSMSSSHRNPEGITPMLDNYERHLADDIPRWDKPGSTWNSGKGMEIWAYWS